MIIIAIHRSILALWIYFQRARDDDESLARAIIGGSPSVTGVRWETKAGDAREARRGRSPRLRGKEDEGGGSKVPLNRRTV